MRVTNLTIKLTPKDIFDAERWTFRISNCTMYNLNVRCVNVLNVVDELSFHSIECERIPKSWRAEFIFLFSLHCCWNLIGYNIVWCFVIESLVAILYGKIVCETEWKQNGHNDSTWKEKWQAYCKRQTYFKFRIKNDSENKNKMDKVIEKWNNDLFIFFNFYHQIHQTKTQIIFGRVRHIFDVSLISFIFWVSLVLMTN